MKRLIWALRFYPALMLSGLALIVMGGSMLYAGPPESAISDVAVPVIWMFGAIPWHLSCVAGAWCLAWALFLGKDAYTGV